MGDRPMLGRQGSGYSLPSTTQRGTFHAGTAQTRFRSARRKPLRTLTARGEAWRHAQHRHRRGSRMRQHLSRIPQQLEHAVVVVVVVMVRIVLVVRLMPVEETGAAAAIAMAVRQQAAVRLRAIRPRTLRERAGNHHRHQQQRQHQHAISQNRLHGWYSSSPNARGQVPFCGSAYHGAAFSLPRAGWWSIKEKLTCATCRTY